MPIKLVAKNLENLCSYYHKDINDHTRKNCKMYTRDIVSTSLGSGSGSVPDSESGIRIFMLGKSYSGYWKLLKIISFGLKGQLPETELMLNKILNRKSQA
jgi:hypothetical protein